MIEKMGEIIVLTKPMKQLASFFLLGILVSNCYFGPSESPESSIGAFSLSMSLHPRSLPN